MTPRHADNRPVTGGRHSRKKPPLFAQIIGVIGEILITISLVLGLFVFWQIVWTSWEVSAVADKAIADFEKSAKPLPKVGKKLKIGEPRTDAPPVSEPANYGEDFATLYVPSWNKEIPISEGTGLDIINAAKAGHYKETQQLGDLGNFAIAAHRLSYGNAFQNVHKLKKGDRIVAATKDNFLVYEVDHWEIVNPTDVEVLEPVPWKLGEQPTERLLTMTTCDPIWGNTHRYIVYTKFVHWMPRESGIPQELANMIKE